MVGGKIVVTADGQDVDTRMSGFTVSPHEECAVEEAVRLVERHGGSVTVLTLGPPAAADQLRDMLSLGASRAVLLETDGREWGPIATAEAIVAQVTGAATDPAASPHPAVPGPAASPDPALPGPAVCPDPALPDPAASPAPALSDPAASPEPALPSDLLFFGNERSE